MSQIPSAAEWLNTCGAAASKDWKAGWNALREYLLEMPAPENFERWWQEDGVKAIGLESGKSFALRTWNASRATRGVKGDQRGL